MKRCGSRGAFVGIALSAVLSLAGCAEELSDTGPIGTWARTVRGGRSIIAIWPTDDGLRFRWNRTQEGQPEASGPRLTIRCGVRGPCEEYLDEAKIYEYVFRTFRREGSDGLFVECEGRPINPALTPVHYIDRLDVQPGGLELWSYQVELNGEPRDPPAGPYKFTKVSDDPF